MATTVQGGLEKRVLVPMGEEEHSSIPTTVKKRKLLDAPPATSLHQLSELDSALALASLAGLGRPRTLKKEASWDETRSPKAEEAPTSPDQRFPGSPRNKSGEEDAPDTPESNKRVHFASGTKEQNVPETPPIDRAHGGGTQSSPSRRLMMPAHGQTMGPFGPRPQPPMSFSPASYRSPPPMPHYPLHAPHPPSPFYHHHLQQHPAGPQPWFHSPAMAATMASRMAYPPPRLMQPALMHPENQWICDFCNVASFSSYDECCTHEHVCSKIRSAAPRANNMMASPYGVPSSPYRQHQQMHYRGPHANHMLMSRSTSADDDSSQVETGPVAAADSDTWFSGSMSLAMGESDSEWLSELNCYIRRHCVEAFSATEEDSSRSSKRGRVAVHQVGIRCRFCASHKEEGAGTDKAASIAAVSFPTSIGGIYESVKRWQRVHVDVCEFIPQEVRSKIESLSKSSVWVPTTRQYWSDSARAMGLVNTTEGIRFGVDPDEIASKLAKEVALKIPPLLHQQRGMGPLSNDSIGGKMAGLALAALGTSSTSDAMENESSSATTSHVVFPEDMDMIPTYVYFLMRQVEPCRFTEADRFVARSKGPVGYPGFQCRHCQGHAGLGKYFPVSAKSLSTNSTSQNIHAHILKCRKTPSAVKDRLLQLKIEKGRSPRLEPGWRKIFFDKVWARLHEAEE